MSASKVFNSGVIVWQHGDDENVGNPALLLHVDNGNTLVLEQEGREICIDWSTVEPLIKALREKQKTVKK